MPSAGTEAADSWDFWIDRGGTFTDVVGRKPDGDHFPWERVDLVDDLKAAVAA